MPTLGEAVNKMVEIRDKRRRLKDDYEKADEPYKVAMERLEAFVLDGMNKAGLSSLPADKGTAYTSTIQQCKLVDRGELVHFVMGDPSAFDIFNNTLNREYVRNFVEAHHRPPPGVEVEQLVKVNLRKN